MPKPKTPTAEPFKTITVNGMDGDDYAAMLERRVSESQNFWNGKKYKLEKVTKENEKLYYGEQVSDNDEDEDENLSLDNRIFSSMRTIVPHVTTRITEPEVYPSSNEVAAKKFAEDFEKALHSKARKEKLRKKLKHALEDAMVRRRGYLKLRYDEPTKNWCSIDYIPCESIIIDHKAKNEEEPRYFRHLLDKTPEDLISMFPEMKPKILAMFKLTESSPPVDMQKPVVINEDWNFVIDKDGALDLVVCWNYNKKILGCQQDPNWNYDGDNMLDNHTMPLIFFNVLNDGRTHIDRTSFIEQAKYAQRTIDTRGRQIGENAGLGNIGMPVVYSGAMADDQAQYITFEPDQVLELDVPDGRSINDVFTTWKAGTLSPDVYKDKVDAIAAVENAFGATSVQQGTESGNKTLGQDELLRDQSVGRQAEIVDAVDDGMERLYPLMAQFLLIYGEEDELFKYVGENATFDYIIMHTPDLDTNAEIQVKNGTSMPVDNPQRRATADKAAAQKMIDPLSYWEIMDQPNAQKYAKRLMDFMADPASFIKDTEEEIFSRDAYVDIEMLKNGQEPPYRDSLDKEYFDYLNQYILSGDLDNPQLDIQTKQSISQFIDVQLMRAQKMLGMAETQLPTPQDVATHNDGVDQANEAAANAPQPAGQPSASSAPQPVNQ